MPRHINSVDQHLDANGNPYSGGKLYFYDTGTSNLKTTFSDLAESSANANPVILDAAGREPDIFYTGAAKVVLDDSADVEVWESDPVESKSTANAAYDLYDSSVTYTLYERVRATNTKYYHSLSATNLNNEPSISPTKWTEIRAGEVWNTEVTYALGDVVITSTGLLKRSLVGSNSGNAVTDNTKWGDVVVDKFQSLKTASFTMIAGIKYNIDASTSVDAALATTIADGDTFIVHNVTTSTATVRVTNTHTIKGAGGSLTTGNHLILAAGDTVHLVAVSSSVLEIV